MNKRSAEKTFKLKKLADKINQERKMDSNLERAAGQKDETKEVQPNSEKSRERPSGLVVSVNISRRKSVRKKPGQEGVLIEDQGLEGDAHAGPGLRQVSLLALESIDKMKQMGLEVGPGDFAENITTSGLDLPHLLVGTVLETEAGIVLEVTQIGKTCHTKCAIFRQVGECVMPREGIFVKVIKGGKIKAGDKIYVRQSR